MSNPTASQIRRNGVTTDLRDHRLPTSVGSNGQVLSANNGNIEWKDADGNVNDVTVNGTSVVSNKVAVVTVPTKTSDITNDSGYITSSAISGKEDASNKVTSISSSSTDLQYPSAKLLYDTKQDLKEIAEGKTNSYVVSIETNPSFNTQAASFQLTGTFTDINDVVHNVEDLKLGDNIYVQEVDVPDRWCSNPQEIASEGVTLHKLETAKVPVTDVQKNGVSVVTNNVANITVPTKTSDITNDSGFITSSALTNYMTLNTDQESSAVKTFGYTEDLTSNKQLSIVKILSNHTSRDMTPYNAWCGRVMMGTEDKTFLMGVYNSAGRSKAMCGIGAHSWTSARSGTGAAWEDIYINPDGNKSLYIGGHTWTPDSGWLKIQNTASDSGGKVYYNKGTISSPSWKEVTTIDDSNTSSTSVTWSASKLNTQFGTKQDTITATNKLGADLIIDGNTNKMVTQAEKNIWSGKSTVTVASTGTATDTVQYITVDGVEKKLAGGGGGDVADVKVNGTSVVDANKVAQVTVPVFVETTLDDYLENEATYSLTNNIYFVGGSELTDVSTEAR